jgi:MoaA/NifB/PqqE/SkfB family radical SAM enzyme
MIDYCKAKGLRTKLTTNGTLVDGMVQRKILDSGLDSLAFSLENTKGRNGEGHLEVGAIENLKGLLSLRKAKIPEVVIQVTLHQGKENDLYELICLGAEMGADRINLSRLDVRLTPSLKRPSKEEEGELFRKANRLGKEKGIQVDFIPYAVSHGIERLFYRVLRRSLHRFGRYCLRFYDYLYVNLKGEVTPCCSLPLYAVGNILENGLKEIWRGERLKDFRRKQKVICGQCDQWEVRQKEIYQVLHG